MTIIDFHTHVFAPEQIARRDELLARDRWFGELYGNPRAPMATAEELLASMDRLGITRSVLFSFPWQDSGFLREANDYVFESAAREVERFVPFVTLHPNSEGVEEELARSRPVAVGGLGELMPDGNGYRVSDIEVMRPLAHFAMERGIPLIVHASEPFGHLYPGKGRTYAEEILALVRAFPELKVVCAHWGGGLIFYELQPELARELVNVYYDTAASCFVYDDRIYRVAAELCPEKVLFGSDFPVCPVDRQLKAVLDAEVPDDLRAGILSGNADRLLARPRGDEAHSVRRS